jgi:hypothetical protein
MIIIDGQIHLWEKGTPSAHHRQQPYLAEQAIAAMDAAGVDRALIHPVLWDPDSNELAIEAVRRYPDRFAIMGWFYLDDPRGRDIVVLNKCGKLEAAGGGLRDAFAYTDAGKALSFSAAGPVNGRRWRLPGMQTRDLRLLKTLKTATVASTPLAIW